MAVDPKYGRIFTESDIEQVLGQLADALTEDDKPMADRVKDALDQINPQIPADETVFLVRAQDKHALPLIDAYAEFCQLNGSPPTHLSNIMNARSRVEEWQRANPDKVKVPD